MSVSSETMKILHVDSFKRDNGNTIGIAVLPENMSIRYYISAEDVFYKQSRDNSDRYMIEYDEENGTTNSFQIYAEKHGQEYFIAEPKKVKQKQVFNSIPEYIYRTTDSL